MFSLQPTPLTDPQDLSCEHRIKPKVDELILLFDDLFACSDNTRLQRGDDEPVYLPANDHCEYHRIVFAHGFFASALHEIAHWCIAGPARRMQIDYGYWYTPDGRTPQQQLAFEQVEIKPQALEWIFSTASGKGFRISVDNLDAEQAAEAHRPQSFKRAVWQQVAAYCESGLPLRAERFYRALTAHYRITASLDIKNFSLDQLD